MYLLPAIFIVFAIYKNTGAGIHGIQPCSVGYAVLVPCCTTSKDLASNTSSVYCPSGCIGKNLSVWGTDIYTENTSVCLAAIHAGLVSNGGGYITVQKMPGQAQYNGSIRNGITSLNSKTSSTSFTILATMTGSSNIPPSTTTSTIVTTTSTASTIHTTSRSTTPLINTRVSNTVTTSSTTIMTVNIGQIQCSSSLDVLEGDPLLILCPPNCNTSYVVWGTDIYTSDSDVCPSAIHAGVITAKGGYVMVKREPLQPQYFGTYQNGIQSLDSSSHLVFESYTFL